MEKLIDWMKYVVLEPAPVSRTPLGYGDKIINVNVDVPE